MAPSVNNSIYTAHLWLIVECFAGLIGDSFVLLVILLNRLKTVQLLFAFFGIIVYRYLGRSIWLHYVRGVNSGRGWAELDAGVHQEEEYKLKNTATNTRPLHIMFTNW